MRLTHILVITVVALCRGASIFSQDLVTTNREALNSFFAAVEAQQRPVTVVSFGDSMADSYRSIGYVLMEKFTDALGLAGISGDNYHQATMVNVTNGAWVGGYSPLWFGAQYIAPPGGAVWWEKQYSPGGVMANRVGLFYVKYNGGGEMSLEVSTNTGPWTQLLRLQTYSESPIGCYTNVDLPLDLYRMRVTGVTGTNVVIAQQLIITNSPGLNASF